MRLAALMFLAGGMVMHQLASLPSLALLVAGVAVALLLSLLLSNGFSRAVLWLLLGCAWAVWHGEAGLVGRLPAQWQDRTFSVSGNVSSPVHKTGLSRFILEPDQPGFPQRIRVAWYDPPERIGAGERWRLRVRLRLPVGFSNPGGFDYEQWLFRQGIGATAYVVKSGENARVTRPGHSRIARHITWHIVWREAISEKIARLTRGLEYGAIIRALTVGDRSHMQPGHWETLNATGTNHLLAISGLHVGLVAVFGFAAGRLIWGVFVPSGLRREQMGAMAGFCIALVYTALSGFAIPAQRAVLMVAGVLLALLSARTVTPGQFLSAALLIIVIADPLAVMDAGLWLSFIAVVSIVWVVRQRPVGFFRQWGMVQGAVSLALIPALLIFFQRVSLVAPLVNLIAIPVVGMLIVPLCLAGVAALVLNESLARGLWLLADRVIHMMWWGLEQVAAWPGVLWTTPSPSQVAVLAGSVGILALLGPLRRVLWVPGCILMSFLMFAPRDAPEYGEARVTLLDVGQGLSAIVETSKHTLVYDAGPRFRSGFDTGSGVVAPYLRSRGIDVIDMLVISHGDMDHRGGMHGLMNAIPVRELMVSNAQLDSHARLCTRGDRWNWDGVDFHVLHPAAGLFKGNNASCVLRVTTGGMGVLLPGDVEKAAEAWLVENAGKDLKADVLVAPHHGSDTSSTVALLNAVGPSHVLIPAGYGNRFGLPSSDVVARYEALGIGTFVAGCEGALTFSMGEHEQLLVRGWRVAGKRYWTLQPCGEKRAGQR